MSQPDFATFCREVRARHAQRKPGDKQPETPFCLDDGKGTRIDSLQQVKTTLFGLLAILLGIAAAITAIWTRGTPFLVLAALCAGLTGLWWLRHAALQRLAAAWHREASAYPAALVMANSGLFEPGNSVLPGLLAVDFGKAPDAERLAATAASVHALLESDAVPPDHAPVRDWLQAGTGRARFDRLHVPTDLAGNDTTWLVSLRLDRAMMPNGHLDRRHWFVQARPDRNESAELLPAAYWAS